MPRFDTARKLATLEGIWGGITSGADVWAAIQMAKRRNGSAAKKNNFIN
ncbi:MAG: hypothetical protein KJ607_00025 [Bacteroidetes bacterium]|nr:hypothetical protein [Bacteroidota bacterium]